MESICSAVDLTPSSTKYYDIYVFETVEPGVPCIEYAFINQFFMSLEAVVAVGGESMILTGDAMSGSTATATAKVPGSLVGNDFDLWVCPDQAIYPDDNSDANGDCVGQFIQQSTGDTTSFYLGFDPVRDAGDEEYSVEFWQASCDQYFIVHDFPNGGDSNWIGPVVCNTTAQLAETGAIDTAGAIGIGGLVAILLGGALVIIRRATRSTTR